MNPLLSSLLTVYESVRENVRNKYDIIRCIGVYVYAMYADKIETSQQSISVIRSKKHA
jgi:hypothetical protein